MVVDLFLKEVALLWFAMVSRDRVPLGQDGCKVKLPVGPSLGAGAS